MIRIPSRTKYKKMHRHTIKNLKLKTFNYRNNIIKLMSIQKAYFTLKEIIDLRIFIRKSFRKKIKIFTPLLVNYHKTQKGLGMRMGKGKGKGKEWYISATYGTTLFELMSSKRNFSKMKDILKYIQKKLAFKTQINFYEKNLQESYQY